MTMMRRGPLDKYPMDWVLRQAGAHGSSGAIELHGPTPITVYLRDGRVCFAAPGVDGDDPRRRTVTTVLGEDEARRQVVGVLATAIDQTPGLSTGWYYHDPLAVPLEVGPWRWEPAGLLMDARAWAHQERSLGPWTTAPLALDAHGSPNGVTLGPDAWSVVVALSEGRQAGDVLGRLGWTADRLVAALEELQADGALRAPAAAPPADSAPPVAPSADRRPDPDGAAAAVAAAEEVLARSPAVATRWPGPVDDRPLVVSRPPEPVVAAPVVAAAGGDERRGALRRLIDSLRPA